MSDLKLAWRNTLRNLRRTLLTALVIAVGLAALIFVEGLIEGMKVNMIRSATQTLQGEAQIHARGYREEPDVDLLIPLFEQVSATLQNDPAIAAWSPRTLAQGMLASASGMGAVQIYGVEPEQEVQVSLFRRGLVSGVFLSGEKQEIILGKKLAEELEVSLGDRIVLTAASSSKAGSGDLTQELFRVSGIFDLQSNTLNSVVALVNRSTLLGALRLGPGAHEIALRFKELNHPPSLKFENPEIEYLLWPELMPALYAMLEMTNSSMLIMGFILFGVISFGVVNSLLMSLYERMYEFGVLKAVGTRPTRIARLILLESLCLGMISIAIGTTLGLGLTLWFSRHGIQMPSTEYAGTVLRDPIFVISSRESFIRLPLFVLGLTLLAGVYPAWIAAHLNPSQAMRKSL